MAAVVVCDMEQLVGPQADERECRRDRLTQEVDKRLSYRKASETFKSSEGNDSQDGPESCGDGSTLGSTLEGGQWDKLVEARMEDPEAAVRQMPGVREVHNLLGVGSFSHVYSCTIEDVSKLVAPVAGHVPLTTKASAAVKLLHKAPSKENREVRLMLELDHPHLVRLLRVVDGPPYGLMLELCTGGTLHDLVHGSGNDSFLSLDSTRRAWPAHDVALALEYLHLKSIVHRDVKSQNCFLSSPPGPIDSSSPAEWLPPVKLGDLGCARTTVIDCMTRAVGSVRSMAPEVITGEHYGVHADMFSFAVLLHQLLTGQAPYASPKCSNAALAVAIVRGLRPPLELLPKDHIGRGIAPLLEGLWCAEPEARPPASTVVRHLDGLLRSE
eukprot:gnl/TRDRNA2_/TRDRNA2_41959_c0_seq1.p1 gnl/TRDRNA2_/TRDRNA2_41959_c0~~gnl/TRDRNA2_/TRDRNA2_41959_c0_seq1.p1  ORF type:complete len:402 (-),score=63.57 gnl/TRDRNA2_/TRDRNA2_41959_c0_seq1:123-1274(-)